MKIPEQLLTEIVRDIAGNEGVSVINILKDRDNYSEFKIAEKLNVTINQVRNVLYKLSEKGLLTFTRKKEKEKGWYVYFWTLDKQKTLNYIIEYKQQKITHLRQQLAIETTTTFYKCPTSCIRVSAEHALELNYQCNECGKVLAVDEVGNRVERIQRLIQQHQQDLEEIKKLVIPPEKPEAKPKKDKKLKGKKNFKKSAKKMKKKLKKKR